ncbi:MAG TPA: tRNA (adenosine(37)-N6)-dimethylallyltransferase MiaA, partial [Chloroflexota bacterium]
MRQSAGYLVSIFGPTASGKSTLALRLCETLPGEIITADSRQVFRYMDIGTDKPSAAERSRVPHHMIDLVDPDEPFTLADYQDGAHRVIDEVLQRGKIPVLAGGTPLYVFAVLDGWTIPRVEPRPDLRAALEHEAMTSGIEALHARLRVLDPKAADGILPSNGRRI